MANIESNYTQQTWVAGATPLSEAALNNIDAGLEDVKKYGFFKNGTTINSNITLPNDGYNYSVVGEVDIADTYTLVVEGKCKIL